MKEKEITPQVVVDVVREALEMVGVDEDHYVGENEDDTFESWVMSIIEDKL